jgi:hypothetical protein
MAEIYTYQPRVSPDAKRAIAERRRRLGLTGGPTSTDLDVKSAVGLRKAREVAEREAKEQQLAKEDFLRQQIAADALKRAIAERASERAQVLKIAAGLQREKERLPTDDFEWLQKINSSNITARNIIDYCCKKYNVTPLGVVSRRQLVKLSRVRGIIAYLMSEMTLKSTTEIGRILGNRDHSTVVHCRRKVEDRVATDPEFAAEIAGIKTALEAA